MSNLSVLYMDPENELNSLRAVESCFGTLETIIFLGTFRHLKGDVKESSWLVFSLAFYFCVLCLWPRAQKVGFNWRRKHPSVSLRVLGNIVASIRPQLCCG